MPTSDSLPPDPAGRGRELVRSACKWIEAHPDGFADLLRTAQELTAAGYDVSRSHAWSWMQELGRSKVSERPTWSRDNNLWAPLARYMMLVDESLRIPTRGGCTVDIAYPDPRDMPIPVLKGGEKHPWLQSMKR